MDRGDAYFLRQGITVHNSTVVRERVVRALVVIQNTELSTLLGDAENPAHTEWQERSAKFRDKYDHGPGCLRFVRNSASGIVRILTAASEERDRDLLKDLFFVIKPGEKEQGDGEKAAGKKPRRQKEGVKLPPPEKIIRLRRTSGGFSIGPHPGAPDGRRHVEVRVGYAVRKGNSIKRYVPEDFRLDAAPISVESQNVNLLELVDNRLVFDTAPKDYSVAVSGFDPHRDLEIRLRHQEATDETAL
ncbi:MAG: hypothetical protein ABSB35_15980 [Bryobacteraceae bacterium]